MDQVRLGIKNWQDGRRIEDYCREQGYFQTTVAALREMHRLHLEQANGTLGGTPQEALEVIAKATPEQKQIIRSIGQQTNLLLCDALMKMAENPSYAARILNIYQTDIKPNIDL